MPNSKIMGFFKKAREAFRNKIEGLKCRPCEKVMAEAHKKYFEHLYKQKVVENAVNVGHKVPDFEIVDAFGQKISVSERLQQGPLVIKFFRGTWCAYCAADLQFLSENFEEISKYGANAIALSAMTPESLTETAKEGNYPFPLASDVGLQVARKFGLTVNLPQELVDLYKENLGIDLAKYFGKIGVSGVELILPGTYVVNQQGIVVYTFLEEDFKKRADMAEVVRVLKRAKSDQKRYLDKCYERDCEMQYFVKSMIKKVQREKSSSSSSSSSSSLFKKREKQASSPTRSNSVSSSSSSSSSFSSLSSLASDKDPLAYTLRHDGFIDSFKVYLQKTFCMENLLFYLEVMNFHDGFNNRTRQENITQAEIIFDTFIKIGSDLELNLDDGTREAIFSDFKQGYMNSSLYTEAAKEVYRLMESDSFSKWKRTKEYAEVWKKNGSLDFLSPTPGFAAEAA